MLFAEEQPAATTRARRKKTPEEDAYNKVFGERLKVAREKRGFSQPTLAYHLRIGLDQYKKHELGKTAFPTYLLETTATILEKSITWLITGRG